MVASKELLDKYLIYSGLGSNKMIRGKALEDVIDKFEYLNCSNLQNTISLFRSGDIATWEEPMIASWL